MADEIVGQRMSDYTDIDESSLTAGEKAYYKEHAKVTTFGKTGDNDASNSNYNVPLSEITGSVLPEVGTDAHRGDVLTVNNSDEVVWATPSSSMPNLGKGLVYNQENDCIDFNPHGSGGLFVDSVNNRVSVKHGNGIGVDESGVHIATDGASDGDVLTYNATTHEVGWAAGGGSPYTKVSVAPGTRYKNGKTSSYSFELFDQDVSISNNTYSVLSSDVGYTSGASFPDASGIDVLKIKLPANTEFPMAVVEFNVYHYVNDYECGAVNDVEVYVGNTKLTKILPHPYRKDTLVGKDLYSDNQQKQGYGGSWYIEDILDSNTLFSKTAFVATAEGNPIVQVNIFGNCFTISTNVEANAPVAS